MTGLDFVNINAHATFGQMLPIIFNILSEIELLNEILTSVKGYNSVTIVYEMMCHSPNLDLVKFINACVKFGKILSFSSQDIERKRNYDGRNHYDRRMDG